MPDAHQSECHPGQLPLRCLLLLIAVTSEAVAGESSGQISSTDITQSVVSSLPKSQGRRADVRANLDLTGPFETRTQWTFVAAILPGSHFSGAEEQPVDGGALALCFVDRLASHCRYETPKNDPVSGSTPIELYSATVVSAGADNTRPLLLIKTGSAHGADGGHSIYTELFTYDRQSNEFLADPTSSAPFGFWISVFARDTKDRYSRPTLRYRSATHYGDGNHLAVIDSEMPGILRRMGLWKPGDPLPAPPGCSRPVLRHGEEWCQ
jgi:hypothetical protein